MSDRIQKLNSLVMKEVAGVIARELEFPIGCMVTVTRARVADDAESAKVWISVLPAEQGERALEIITKNIGLIQRIINRKLVMKFVPKLMFALDSANDKADHIVHVLDSLTD